MFKKLSTLLLALPVISALQLSQPTVQVHSSSSITITWTTSPGDPATFDLYLTNDIFRNTFALRNTIATSDGTITVLLPVVPAGPGYTFQASPVGDVTTTLSQTSAFDITDPISSSSSLPPSTSGTSSVTSLSGGPPTSTSGIGSTISRTLSPSSGSGTSTGTSPSTSPTGSFNGGNGAIGMTGIGATVVGVLVAAGAFWGL